MLTMSFLTMVDVDMSWNISKKTDYYPLTNNAHPREYFNFRDHLEGSESDEPDSTDDEA